MKRLQKYSFIVLVVIAVLVVGAVSSYASPCPVPELCGVQSTNEFRYRVMQNGKHVTPLQSHATYNPRIFPYPPGKSFDSKAGEIDGYVTLQGWASDIQSVVHCYSLYKGFWNYATTVSSDEVACTTPLCPFYVPQSVVTPIPDDSVVTVVNSNGQPQSDIPVRVVNNSYINAPATEDVDLFWIPKSSSLYAASYDAMYNEHGYTTKDLLKTNTLGKFGFAIPEGFPRQAVFAAKYKGFWHYSAESIMSFPASQTLRMPVESTLSLTYLGVKLANIPVYIVNPDDGVTVMSLDVINTDSSGNSSYAIPEGTRFRYAFYLDNGELYRSEELIAPASKSLIVTATNNPTLLAPANNTSITVGQAIGFDWGTTLNAAGYYWLYRYNGGSWYYMNRGANTFLNLSGLPNAGTWDWQVAAVDGAGKITAMSEVRKVNVVAEAANSNKSANSSATTSRRSEDSGECIDFSNRIDDLKLASKDFSNTFGDKLIYNNTMMASDSDMENIEKER